MNDLINRQAVKDWLFWWEGYIDKDTITRMQCRVIDIPSAEVETVEHGEWKPQISITGTMIFQCSKCGKYNDIHWAYCPYCGSLMDGERGAKMDAREARHEHEDPQDL